MLAIWHVEMPGTHSWQWHAFRARSERMSLFLALGQNLAPHPLDPALITQFTNIEQPVIVHPMSNWFGLFIDFAVNEKNNRWLATLKALSGLAKFTDLMMRDSRGSQVKET